MAVKVHVVYCGGWGYKSKASKLKDQLEAKFGKDKINFSMEATPGISGFLEVTINDVLVHSKKNGDGYVDNDAKLEKIYKAVEAAL